MFWQEKLHDVDLREVRKVLKSMNANNEFGYFLDLAKHSKHNVYKLQASSFCERVNSAGKIVYDEKNLKMDPDCVEKRVLLRMNRNWLQHMRFHYPELTPAMMKLHRASHDALSPPDNTSDSEDE